MTRTGRFLGGLFFGYANQVLVTLIGLWLTSFLLIRLGQQDYGLWLVGTSILGYLMLLDLGVVALLPREVAFATGRAGGAAAADDLPQIVGRTMRLVIWQMPVVALAAVVVWVALPGDWEPLRNPLGVVLAVFVLGFPMRVFQALLEGLQDLAYLGAVNTATWIVGTAVTVALVFAGLGLYALAVGWGVNQVLLAAITWLRVRTRHPEIFSRRSAGFPKGALRDRLTRSMWISIAQLAQVLRAGTDLLIIAKLMGPEAVVPYFCTAKVLTVLGHQPQLLAQNAQPALSELRASPDRHRLADVCTALTRAILILSGAVVCVVLVVNEGFVEWWVGSEQYGGQVLTGLLLTGMVLRHWNVTAVYSLFAFGRDRRISLTTLADGVVTVFVSILLVRRWGLIGAAVGPIVAVTFVALPANLQGLTRELRTTFWNTVLVIWPWLWRFSLMAALAWFSAQVWVPRTLPTLVVATLASLAAYGALMLPFALRDPLGMYVRPRIETLRHLRLRERAGTEADA